MSVSADFLSEREIEQICRLYNAKPTSDTLPVCSLTILTPSFQSASLKGRTDMQGEATSVGRGISDTSLRSMAVGARMRAAFSGRYSLARRGRRGRLRG